MENIKIKTGLNPSQILREVAKHLPIVPFNPDWENGTGYLNGIVNDTTIEFSNGGYATTTDSANRVAIIVHTEIGNYVFFERFSHGQSGVVVSNNPDGYSSFNGFIGLVSSIPAELLIKLLGQWSLDETWCFSPDALSNFQRAIASITRPVTADDEI